MLENLTAKEMVESMSMGSAMQLFEDALRKKNSLVAITTQKVLAKRGYYYEIWSEINKVFFGDSEAGINLDSGEFCLMLGYSLQEMKKAGRIFTRLGRYVIQAKERFDIGRHKQIFTEKELVERLEEDFWLEYVGNKAILDTDSKGMTPICIDSSINYEFAKDFLMIGLRHGAFDLVEYSVAQLYHDGREGVVRDCLKASFLFEKYRLGDESAVRLGEILWKNFHIDLAKMSQW
ncbi:hypothetical protein IKG54_02195 [Candidatus Saccharibacteria bacterium]|nr:hypothetical protein [Candidatus Saccharibacteria bacterium]